MARSLGRAPSRAATAETRDSLVRAFGAGALRPFGAGAAKLREHTITADLGSLGEAGHARSDRN